MAEGTEVGGWLRSHANAALLLAEHPNTLRVKYLPFFPHYGICHVQLELSYSKLCALMCVICFATHQL